MNRELAVKIANTVLYEGSKLYPNRPSAIKDRQRWSFGILYPAKYDDVKRGAERSQMHSECLLKMPGETLVHVQLRFLHLLSKKALRAVDGRFEPAASVIVDGELVEPWDETVERSVEFDVLPSDELEQFFQFSFDGSNDSESLRDVNGEIAAELTRSQAEIQGTMLISCQLVRNDVLKLSIDVENTTAIPSHTADRDSVLLSSFLSAHLILAVDHGEFVSLLKPPDELLPEIRACRNVGVFPVLVGSEDQRDMLLCSPIMLGDYPQAISERGEMWSNDDRVRTMPRNDDSSHERPSKAHGSARSLRPASEQ